MSITAFECYSSLRPYKQNDNQSDISFSRIDSPQKIIRNAPALNNQPPVPKQALVNGEELGVKNTTKVKSSPCSVGKLNTDTTVVVHSATQTSHGATSRLSGPDQLTTNMLGQFVKPILNSGM